MAVPRRETGFHLPLLVVLVTNDKATCFSDLTFRNGSKDASVRVTFSKEPIPLPVTIFAMRPERYFRFRLAHRACAAFRAISRRCSGVNLRFRALSQLAEIDRVRVFLCFLFHSD